MTSTNIGNAQSLDDYQWKNRILLLVDESSNTDAITSQLNILNADKGALTERDLLIFIVTTDMVYTSEGNKAKINAEKLFQDYNLKADFAGVVLLGKDGGVNMRESFEVTTKKIFALIDGMPMRRSEIRNPR